MRTTTVLILAVGALSAMAITRSRRRESEMLARAGSPTNASDVEMPQVRAGDDADEVLDVAVEHTFPASDPIAIDTSYAKRS